MAPARAEVQAEILKRDGNICYSKKLFNAAIDAYTEAITLCPNVAVYWTNRALCFRRRNDWTRVEEDCRRAIELDNNSYKALDLGRGAKLKGELEEIHGALAKAKYLAWEDASSERAWKLHSLKENCEKALREKYLRDAPSQMEGECSIVDTSYLEEQLESLAQVFKIATEADTPREVPDHLCCRITLDIFRDPVITPSGVTYERAELLEHFRQLGKFDPITREPLDQHQLVPNLAIKEAVQIYLQEHGWAYKSA